jgi:ABC-2 type transport system permease protein
MIRLVRAELLKLFTTRLWWGLLIGVVATSAAFALLNAFVLAQVADAPDGGPGLNDPAVVRSIYTAGLQVSYLFALALGVIAMAGETRHQTLSATLLSSPRRWRVVVAKLAALVVAGVGYGTATVLAGVAAGLPVIVARGGQARLLGDGVPRALLLAVLAVALWTVLGLGIGTLIRNQVVALLVSIGVAWIVEPIAAFALNGFHVGSVARFLPSQATSALVSPSTSTGGGDGSFSIELLPWWGGALVLVGYAACSGALGTALTLRRDVT